MGEQEEASRVPVSSQGDQSMLVLEVPVGEAGEMGTARLVRVLQAHQGCWSLAVLIRAAWSAWGRWERGRRRRKESQGGGAKLPGSSPEAQTSRWRCFSFVQYHAQQAQPGVVIKA